MNFSITICICQQSSPIVHIQSVYNRKPENIHRKEKTVDKSFRIRKTIEKNIRNAGFMKDNRIKIIVKMTESRIKMDYKMYKTVRIRR